MRMIIIICFIFYSGVKGSTETKDMEKFMNTSMDYVELLFLEIGIQIQLTNIKHDFSEFCPSFLFYEGSLFFTRGSIGQSWWFRVIKYWEKYSQIRHPVNHLSFFYSSKIWVFEIEFLSVLRYAIERVINTYVRNLLVVYVYIPLDNLICFSNNLD